MKSILTSVFIACVIGTYCTDMRAQNVVTDDDRDHVPPQIVTTPRLTPPKEAIESGLGGTVRTRVMIDTAGNVTSVEDVTGPGPVCRNVTRPDVVAMRDAARDASFGAKFSPATRNGQPVASSTWLNFTFPGGEDKSDHTAAPPPPPLRPLSPDKYTVKGDVNFSPATVPPPDYVGPVKTVGEQDDPAAKPTNAGGSGGVPKQISGGVLNGKATSLPKPPYPPAARAVRASGAVSIQVLIDENGEVFSARAVSGHPLLRAAATIAACESRFSPTRLMGNPVKVAGVITYNFVP